MAAAGIHTKGRQGRKPTDFLASLAQKWLTSLLLILKHQDLGQMQMYVNYYDRFVKTEEENPTIGILLCTDKSDAMVEITLPKDNNQIFASKYQTYLPSKEELQKLIEENISK